MVQIQKEQLENRNNINTYASINNHINKCKQKDLNENKNNTTIVRNSNPSIETQELIPQKRDNESLNTDSEMSTYNTMQNKFAQEKSSHSEFYSQEKLIQSKTTENQPYNSSSDKTDHEKINICLLYTSPSPRDTDLSRMPSSA